MSTQERATLESADEAKEFARELHFLDRTLHDSRMVTLFGEINSGTARRTAEKLLALASSSDDPITLYISSPGGHVESGDVIYDMIRFVAAPVRVVGTGWVGSAAALIYLAPEKEQRFCLPNTRFLIHQPAGGAGGSATDIEIHAREILKIRERINRIIADRTGQTLERVSADTDRDYWMSAHESVEYGIVGKVISSISELG